MKSLIFNMHVPMHAIIGVSLYSCCIEPIKLQSLITITCHIVFLDGITHKNCHQSLSKTVHGVMTQHFVQAHDHFVPPRLRSKLIVEKKVSLYIIIY